MNKDIVRGIFTVAKTVMEVMEGLVLAKLDEHQATYAVTEEVLADPPTESTITVPTPTGKKEQTPEEREKMLAHLAKARQIAADKKAASLTEAAMPTPAVSTKAIPEVITPAVAVPAAPAKRTRTKKEEPEGIAPEFRAIAEAFIGEHRPLVVIEKAAISAFIMKGLRDFPKFWAEFKKADYFTPCGLSHDRIGDGTTASPYLYSATSGKEEPFFG